MSLITYDNFHDEVLFFCKGQAKKADGLGVIISDPESDLARIWIGYAESKGWPQRAKLWAQMLKGGCKLTMPCANPRTFDPDFRAVARPPMGSEGTTSATPEARRAVVEKAKARVASASRPYMRGRDDNPPEKPKTEAQKLRELEAKYAADPSLPSMSPELRFKMGLPASPKDQEVAA